MESKSRVLIIGGLGFMGKSLYLHLSNKGLIVHILSDIDLEYNDPFREMFDHSNLIIGDITTPDLLNKIISDYKYVFCFAGLSGAAESINRPLKDVDVNLKGVLNLLEACKNHNPEIQFFFPSSRLVYGKPMSIPVNENHAIYPESIYAIHKLAAEYYLLLYHKLYDLKVIILRISNIYGPYQRYDRQTYSILNWFIYQGFIGEPITLYGDGKQVRDFLYIDDLARLYEILLDKPKLSGNVYNVGYGNGISLSESIKIIKRFIPKLSFKFISWPNTEQKIETGDYISDISLIRNHTSWQPEISFEEGISRTIEFYDRFCKK